MAMTKSAQLRSQLGDFFAERTEDILRSWVDEVKKDPRLTTADSLSQPLLEDHVPTLLQDFVEVLRSGEREVEPDAQQNAVKHGAERWGQGYSYKELVWEIYRLRRVLFANVMEFARGRPDELHVFSVACASVDAFLNELECRSVEKYAEENEAALRLSNEARLRLIRTVSHELRNMLNSVSLASALLSSDDHESIEFMRGNLDRNCGHMREVLDDLLNLSLIVSGQNVAKPTWFEPSPLLKLLEAAHRPFALVKGLKFTATIEGELGPIYSDELRVRQIVENLVSNAIKYTPEGEVHLRFEAVRAHLWAIVVQDTGLGIAEEDRQHIFSEYYQVASASPLRGSGLGLSIVTGLVELLKGSISLESEPSRGSVFRVLLPRIHGTVEKVHSEKLPGDSQ